MLPHPSLTLEAKYERVKSDFEKKMEAFKAAGGEVQKRARKSSKKVKEWLFHGFSERFTAYFKP